MRDLLLLTGEDIVTLKVQESLIVSETECHIDTGGMEGQDKRPLLSESDLKVWG